jgi:signal transduction histidine kinase
MKLTTVTDHRLIGLKIVFLIIVVTVLISNLVLFHNSEFNISANSLMDPIFGKNTTLFHFIFPNILAWVITLFAFVLIFFERRSREYSQIPIFLLLTSIILSSTYTFSYSQMISAIWLTAVYFFSFHHFQYYFPELKNFKLRMNFQISVYVISIILFFSYLFVRISNIQNLTFGPFQLIVFWSGLLMVGSIFFCFMYLINKKNSISPDIKFFNAIATIIAFTPFVFWLFLTAGFSTFPFSPWISFPMALPPLILGFYLTERMDGKKKITDFMIFDKISNLLIVTSCVGIILIIFQLISNSIITESILISLLVGLQLALLPIILLLILNKNQSVKINFNNKSQPQSRTADVNHQFNTIGEILENQRLDIKEMIDPEKYYHFIFNPDTDEYISFPFDKESVSNLKFSSDSSIVKYLSETKTPLLIDDFEILPQALHNEKEVLKLLGAQAILPIMSEGFLHGWLALSIYHVKNKNIKNSIEKITQFLSSNIDQIQKINHQNELEHLVGNMNVLSRIVQGVNYTIALDDIYELIFTQTTQIIPADDFYIILKDQNFQKLRYVFCVQLDERISSKENQVLPKTITIESEIVESGRGIILNNYVEYCQKHDFSILYEDIHSAMVVPLNTGAITNGCVLIAHRDSDKSFTGSQLNFVQSIADLVAGAIEKARLLQESELYARQLSILNELTRNLTSTFDLDELYENILKNSVDMIDCEEARLIIFDDKAQQLVFQKVIGDKSKKLLNKRVSLDFGWIGKAYQSKNIVIIDPDLDPEEPSLKNDIYNEISIRSILIIPMVLKNEVLGVIELINRQGEVIFNKNDQGLLSALAAQSAIALENARLYLRTDQALAQRVEELSVMQHIDRELNTSLELKSAMEITLSWAMRQLDANAGWIGHVIENKIQIMASKGYSSSLLSQITDVTSYFSRFFLEKLEKDPYLLIANHENRLHPQAQTQVVVPIQREGNIIALMMIEMFREKTEDENEMKFLLRLSEHASIALINSQLYSEVQAANQAKSKFVSLVAHELKNPMTSIKGYTELLVAGAVGTINDSQASFLTIIRNNTERMNTLVSDLNDLSKIEAGSMRVESRALELKDILNEIVRSTKRQIDEKHQILNINISDDLPKIWGDSNRLLQILTNLVSNAHKYTQNEGEISIVAKVMGNLSDPSVSDNFIQISVHDNGAGISEDDQQMIFQKFFRSENPKIRESSGTGLGLNITRSLVEMQGGQIWFESVFQKGTSFHFTIPVAKNESPQ